MTRARPTFGARRLVGICVTAALLPIAACGIAEPESATVSSCTADGLESMEQEGTQRNPYRGQMRTVAGNNFAVSTTNDFATDAACNVLAHGGSAADALVVAQTVLGLVEPQSSGLGGGGYVVFRDAKTGKVRSYDGAVTAPASAPDWYLRQVSDTDRSSPAPNTRLSGRSIGIPSSPKLLWQLHSEFGNKPWAELLGPAKELARDGFPVSPRLATLVKQRAKDFARSSSAQTFLREAGVGDPKKIQEGQTWKAPQYAKTLDALSTGVDSFYQGQLAESIRAEIQRTSPGATGGMVTADDMRRADIRVADAMCSDFAGQRLCGPAAYASGAPAVMEALGILGNTDIGTMKPQGTNHNGGTPSPEAAHLMVDAERIAFADRSEYSADVKFYAPPKAANAGVYPLLDPEYWKQRAQALNKDRAITKPEPGDFSGATGVSDEGVEDGTAQITIVDQVGNVASSTQTLQSNFGSVRVAGGIFLNNSLTNFTNNGKDTKAANRFQPGKRPRSTMAPLIVVDNEGRATAALGSPGGTKIIAYLVKTLLASFVWGLNPQQSVSMLNVGAVGRTGSVVDKVSGAKKSDRSRVIRGLRDTRHDVSSTDMDSGTELIRIDGNQISVGTDPRREGTGRAGTSG